MIVGSPLSWLVLAISVFAVIAYSAPVLRFKERPFLDSLTSSTHFVSPAVYGLVLAGATFTPQLWSVLGAFFLWGIASHAFGAVQDVVADREAGIASIATVIGARATVRFAVVAYLLAGILLLGHGVAGSARCAACRCRTRSASLPWWNVMMPTRSRANRGWQRFLWLNFAHRVPGDDAADLVGVRPLSSASPSQPRLRAICSRLATVMSYCSGVSPSESAVAQLADDRVRACRRRCARAR